MLKIFVYSVFFYIWSRHITVDIHLQEMEENRQDQIQRCYFLKDKFWRFRGMLINNDINNSKTLISQCLRNLMTAIALLLNINFLKQKFKSIDFISLKGLSPSKPIFTLSGTYLWIIKFSVLIYFNNYKIKHPQK